MRLGSPALDICYFLCTSTTTDLRQKYFDEFLKIYYTSLAGILRKCGSDPTQIFTFENLLQQIKKFGKCGLAASPILIEIMVADRSDITDIEEFAKDSLENENAEYVLVNMNDESKLTFKERLNGVIEDAIKYGMI